MLRWLVIVVAIFAAFAAGTWYGNRERVCVSAVFPDIGLTVTCRSGGWDVPTPEF